jgi:hypothetical protein
VQIKVTSIPVDFLLDKKKLKVKELSDRFSYGGGRRIFDKNVPETKMVNGKQVEVVTELPEAVDPMEDFGIRLSSLRDFTMDLWHPRLRAAFLERIQKCLPELHDIKTIYDFLQWYRDQPYGNNVRRIVDIVSHKMFTKQMFITMETAIMEKLGLEYSTKTSDGHNCKTHRKHGSILSIGTRMKQTYFIDLIRATGRDSKLEVVHNRLLKSPMKGVVDVISVSKETHGYDGWLGRCAGHPDLLKGQIEAQQAAAKLKTSEERSLEQFLEAKAQEGGTTDITALLQEWHKTDKKPREISVSSTSSTDSPLTQSVSTQVLDLQ